MQKIWILIIFLSVYFSLFSQEIDKSDTLLLKAKTNAVHTSKTPVQLFNEAEKSYKEAIRLKNHKNELSALQSICQYYEVNYDFKKMFETAELLRKKADDYNMPQYNAVARNFLFKVYAYSGLTKEAKQQLEKGLKILKNENENDSLIIEAKANLYISYANYYILLNDNEQRLKYIKLSIREHNKYKNQDYLKELKCIDFSNLATIYLDMNKDSAEFYAKKSVELQKYCQLKDIYFANLIVFGKVYQSRKQYEKALAYYREAEQMKNYKNHLNITTVYENMMDIYREMNDTINLKIYDAKLEKLSLEVSESKNESLSKMICDIEQQNKKNKLFFILITTIVLMVNAIIIGFAIHKRKVLVEQEKSSQQYLEKNINDNYEQEYSGLLEMVKKNDIAFFAAFQEKFPEFSNNIKKINPKIVQSEIEFCALLKLNISTKDIARYRFIEPKSVQNKKYRIRKKLFIPKTVEIYDWFKKI
jgi:hypothetical protein